MTETEFLEASEALMQSIEQAIDAAGLELDCDRSGNVLTIEADSGEQIVVNRHGPTQQMWLATRKGGLHFEAKDGQRINTRDGTNVRDALNEALGFVCAEPVRVKLN